MFNRAILKTTTVYLGIIMLISLFFSANLYRVSVSELTRGFRRQQVFFEEEFRQRPGFVGGELSSDREDFISEVKLRILSQLLYTNLVILILGGGLSFFLARLTIKPIEDAHESQIRFTADASHELRSPLAAIKTEIEVVLRDKNATKADYIAALESNLEEVERLSVLTTHLLELARENENGQKELINLNLVLNEAKAAVQKVAKTKKIKFEVSVPRELNLFGSREKLVQLFKILFENAIKNSAEDNKVTVSSAITGSQVEVAVRDQGVGISKKDLPYIFDRFYKGDVSRTNKSDKSYGLGLSIAKKIALIHGADISVHSEPGKGSTFTVRFRNLLS